MFWAANRIPASRRRPMERRAQTTWYIVEESL